MFWTCAFETNQNKGVFPHPGGFCAEVTCCPLIGQSFCDIAVVLHKRKLLISCSAANTRFLKVSFQNGSRGRTGSLRDVAKRSRDGERQI